jgi:hypothetical protein
VVSPSPPCRRPRPRSPRCSVSASSRWRSTWTPTLASPTATSSSRRQPATSTAMGPATPPAAWTATAATPTRTLTVRPGGPLRRGCAPGRLPPPPRHLATSPGTTWYRLLTNAVGRFISLSTHSYQPTEVIARTVTSRDHTCVWPGCRRPSVTWCHLHHRVPHPEGRTCTDNLAPLCRRHHQVKHADGYDLFRNSDGSHTWTTRHGSTFTAPASEQPVPRQTPPGQDPDGQRGLP